MYVEQECKMPTTPTVTGDALYDHRHLSVPDITCKRLAESAKFRKMQ